MTAPPEPQRSVELFLARAPIFEPSRGAMRPRDQHAWVEQGPVGRATVRVRGYLTVRDLALLIEIGDAFRRAGCPDDNRVRMGRDDAAGWLGWTGRLGGKELRLLERSLLRLQAVGIQRQHRHGPADRWTGTFGLLAESRLWTVAGDAGGYVELHARMAAWLRDPDLAFFDLGTFRRLLERSEIAARLWVMLEAESGPEKRREGWQYRLFAEPDQERGVAALADLLCLADRPDRTVARIREAAAAIAAEDPRYRLRVTMPARRAADAKLVAIRRPHADHQGASSGPPGREARTTRARAADHQGASRARNRGATSEVTVGSLPVGITPGGRDRRTTGARPGPVPIADALPTVATLPAGVATPSPRPPPRPSWSPTPEQRDRARELLETGQIPADQAAEYRRRYHLEEDR